MSDKNTPAEGPSVRAVVTRGTANLSLSSTGEVSLVGWDFINTAQKTFSALDCVEAACQALKEVAARNPEAQPADFGVNVAVENFALAQDGATQAEGLEVVTWRGQGPHGEWTHVDAVPPFHWSVPFLQPLVRLSDAQHWRDRALAAALREAALREALGQSAITLNMLKRNVTSEIKRHDGLFRWEGVPEAIQVQLYAIAAALTPEPDHGAPTEGAE